MSLSCSRFIPRLVLWKGWGKIAPCFSACRRMVVMSPAGDGRYAVQRRNLAVGIIVHRIFVPVRGRDNDIG